MDTKYMEGKKGDVLNSKRVYGIVTQNLMRARSLTGQEIKTSPENLNITLIGGEHRSQCIPVLSQLRNRKLNKLSTNEILTKKIQDSETDVLTLKSMENNTKCCYYTLACASAKFVQSLIKALEGEHIYECAYVKQEAPISDYCRYLSTVVKLGKNGIEDSKIPKLSKKEKQRLMSATDGIQDNIHIGESFITGDDKPVLHKKIKPNKDDPLFIIKHPRMPFN